MSTGTTKAPQLPLAPPDYSMQYQNQLLNVLRMYFVQLDNPGQSAASSLKISGLLGPSTSPLNISTTTLPTQAALAGLKSGDVYVDTTASNVLKIKL